MSDTKRNEFLQQEYMPLRKKSAAKAQGTFHGLSDVMQEAIVLVAMKDVPSTRKKNNDAIQLQATAQRLKIELLKEKNMKCSTEAFIDGLYLYSYRMYFLPECWKDARVAVTKNLKKQSSMVEREYNGKSEGV